MLLTFSPFVRWACGFSGSNGMLIVREGQAHFVTDGRYTEQAEREVEGATLHTATGRLTDYVKENDLLDGLQLVLFQSDHTTVDEANRLTSTFPEIEWKGKSGVLQTQVAQKSDAELDGIRRAVALTDAVFAELLDLIRPGITEQEIGAEIVYRQLRRGAERMSFEPIVASGPNGALPHARPTNRQIQPGDLIVLDFGCVVDGLASDMTRTIAVGEPGEDARKAYGVVQQAQQRAVDAARAGMTGKGLDRVARDVIKEAGYGDYFTHGLGHGVGYEIHEWPRLSYRFEDLLPERAAVTIEPGVYLPGQFGVRIEDLVVLEEDGCRVLTESPKSLLVL